MFAVVWCAGVLMLMFPSCRITLLVKALFAVAGAEVTWSSVYLWRQQHDLTVIAMFQIDRSIDVENSLIEVKIVSSARNESGFGLLRCQNYTATQVEAHRIRVEVTFSSDIPGTAASGRDTTYRVTLTLKANGLEWAFALKTRVARASEVQFTARDADSVGN